ncbi:WXG100 family type VII secretion target [Nocardia carnea]|uniref:WXG100 family type VII secretion target n=1 Tax=Nocardia carnea TaxID=37328 RepID=UPI002458D929|nr:WXG100 family type VII secretion target [Nocardia carnea]
MAWYRSDEAERNKAADDQVVKDQDTKWGQDRAAFSGEWSSLVGEWGGEFAGPAILEKDGFAAMTHQQIWDALQDVDSALINDKATAWRNLATEARDANKEFLDGVNADLEAGWNGQSGTAAVNGVRAFSASFTSLAASFQMVAHGLDLIEGHLAQAKASVGKPDNESTGDWITNALLPDDVFKTPQYRADEAQETARHVMTTYYEPGATDVDSKTPVLPEPVKPVDDGSKPPGTDIPTGSTTTNGTTAPPGTTTDDGTDTGDPGQQPTGEDPQPTEPQSTEPQSTTPQSTTPQSTTPTTPSLTTGSPTAPGTPGLPAGTPSGTPSGAPQTAPYIPGQTVQGSPNKPAGAPAATTAAGTSNRAGRTGMPGMMSPGAARGNREDDDEHETPDYLIYDRGSELLGTQPPALPPGGVIGG